MRAGIRRVLVPATIVAMAAVGVGTTGTAVAKTITVKSGQSIQAAVDKAKEGDTISVAKGTYKENVEISQNLLTLEGKNATIVPPSKPHKGSYCWGREKESHSGICIAPEDFDFENFATREGTVSGVSVSGFTVKNFDGSGIIAFGSDDTKITDNKVVNNKDYGVATFVSTRTVISGNAATAKTSEAGIYIGSSPDSQAEVSDNTSKGAADGIFVRDAQNATFENNTLTGNCIGVLVLGDAPGPAGNSTFSNNTISKNNKFCPAEDGPSFSGIGVGIASSSGVAVQENTITDNKASKQADITGGVVILTIPSEEPGATPTASSNNSVSGNTITGSEPDIRYDGSGTNNTFTGNTCTASEPEGLCTT